MIRNFPKPLNLNQLFVKLNRFICNYVAIASKTK